MTRTDIHRPSAPEFDPETYDCFGVYDLHEDPFVGGTVREYREAVARLLSEGNTWASAPYGTGKCSHCGSNLRYVALMIHVPTRTLLNVGETCLDNRFGQTKTEFRAAQKRAAEARATHARLAAWHDMCTELPALAWASYAENIAVAGAQSETVPVYHDEPNGPTWERTVPGTRWDERHRQGRACEILSDIARKARRYGSLSTAQVDLVVRLVAGLESAEGEQAARDARRAEERAARVNAHQGTPRARMTWSVAVVRYAKVFDGQYGARTLVVLDTDGGALKWWASGVVGVRAGERFAVKATVKEHETYDGEPFTVVLRTALTPVA